MSRLIFVTGGARSGKSGFAARLAEEAGGRPTYLATATPDDSEMSARIERHKAERGVGWDTVEEPIEVAAALAGIKTDGAVVLDCITLWLTNLLMEDLEGFESVAVEKAEELIRVLRGLDCTAVVVSNEVGMGIVPDNALARRFRDAAGTVNRMLASAADEVYLVVSGQPLRIKP